MSNIILLVGESGCGKSTIAAKLEAYGLKSIKSYTTRSVRENDRKDADTHTFISDEEFDKLSDIVGYTEFNGYRYCATAEQVDNADIWVIDPKGVEYFRQTYKGTKKPIVVYIDVPEEERAIRMGHRGDNLGQISDRLAHDREAFKTARDMADFVICNVDKHHLREGVDFIFNLVRFGT